MWLLPGLAKLKVTVGSGSLSVIVKFSCCVPLSDAPPPDTVISIIAVSFGSFIESSTAIICTVPVVFPAEIVMFDKEL